MPSPLAGCGPSDGANKGGHKGGRAASPAEVTVMTVAPKAIPVAFEYVGQTAGSREVEVRARVTGILLKRNFDEGGPVEQGQSLFSIDPAPFEAARARAQADVAAAEARLEQAQRNAARFKPLYAEKAVSQKDYDDAVSAEQIGNADVKAARARLAEARLNLGYTKVEAPVSGVAGRALRSEGSLVSGPDVLLTTVVQANPIWVNFGIPDNDQARLTQGDPGRPPDGAERRPVRGGAGARRRHAVRPDRQAQLLRYAHLGRHRHARDARRAAERRRPASPRPVRARGAARRDAIRTRSPCRSARCSRARRASSSTSWARRASPRCGRCRPANGPAAATGSSPTVSRRASA